MFTIIMLVIFAVCSVQADELPGYAHPVKSMPFKVGEKLKFKVRYGFIKAGTAEMKVMAIEDNKYQHPVVHLQTTAKSARAFDWIYKVRDEVNSYFDLAGFYPYRYEKKLREGGYRADLFVDYLHEDSLAKVNFIRYDSDMKIKSNKNYDVEIPPGVFDVLSSFYYVRTQNLEVGKSIFIANHEKDKIYNLEVKVHKKETLEVDAGKFNCLVIEPLLQGEGIFKQKGSLKVWVTDDSLKIPVQMTSEVAVGHITTELTGIEGVESPIEAKLK